MSSSQKAPAGTTHSRVVEKARNFKAALTQNFKAATTQVKGVTAQNKATTTPTQNSNTAGTSPANKTVTAQSNNAAVPTQNNNTAVTSLNNNAAVTSLNNNTSGPSQSSNLSGTNQNNNAALTTQNNSTAASQNNNSGTATNNSTVSALITNSAAQGTNTTTQNMTQNTAPSKSQVEQWTSSINKLLSDPKGVKHFRKFLEENESDDEKGEKTKLLDFYMECEQYKYEFKVLEEKALKIYEKYLAVGADQEVPAGDGCPDIGDKLDDEGLEGVTIFDKPQENIKKFMADGIYNDFCSYISKLKL